VNSFQHVLTLISIIIGLGLAQILTNFNSLIKERKKVRFYWLPIYWAIGTFFLQVQWWWGIYKAKDMETWNFLFFSFIILNPISMFLASGSVLPKASPDINYDLQDYYYSNRRWYFILMAFNPLLDILRHVIFIQEYFHASNLANLIPLVFLTSLAFVKNQTYHIIVTILLTVSLIFFIATFSFKLV
jgi:hypothetical protein